MIDAADPELPRGIALAWGVAAHPQRGPKRELSVERIVEAAIGLADAGGLAAVSMAAVASSLGFTPMSLYRYVTAKDDLVLLMQDAAVGVPPEAVREARERSGWRAALVEWAAGNVDVYRRHPWILDVPVVGVTTTPRNAAWLDAGLEALAGLPVTEGEKLAIVLSIMGQLRWQGLIERSYAEAAASRDASPDELDDDLARTMRLLLTAEEFPWLFAALEEGAFTTDPTDPFAFGLERVLDGIERHLDARAAGAPPPAPAVPEEAPEVLRDPKVKEAAARRREAEKALREARKREREALKAARERAARRPSA